MTAAALPGGPLVKAKPQGEGRAALVVAARDSIALGSRSFALASRLFDSETRERVWLLYAWCRRCDDIIDGQTLGGELSAVADPARQLALVRERTQRALAGDAVGDPAFDGLGVVAREVGLPAAWPEALIAGFAMDAGGFRPADDHGLMTYCWHVAGVVGVMMAKVMGVPTDDRETLIRAADLGLAFQLNNIARDLVEDWRGGRCYLPAEWLAGEGLTAADYGDPANRAALARLADRLGERAALHEHSALFGTPALPRRSAAAVIAAARIYGWIGREVRARGAHAWDERVSSGRVAKIGHALAGQALGAVRRWRWAARPPRPGLWTPPAL
jgi:phytoene synthase